MSLQATLARNRSLKEGDRIRRLLILRSFYVPGGKRKHECLCACGCKIVLFGKYILKHGECGHCGYSFNGELDSLRPIPLFPGYFLTEDLKIVSVRNKFNVPLFLKIDMDAKGYAGVPLVNDSKKLKAKLHRIVWAVKKGHWDFGLLDHKDRDVTNNREDNLREVTASQNQRNRKPNKGKKYKGISKRISGGRVVYQASIRIEGKEIYLGIYATPEEAARAYNMEIERHGVQAYALLNDVSEEISPCRLSHRKLRGQKCQSKAS